MSFLITLIISVLVICIMLYLLTYIPGLNELYTRVLNGQWFMINTNKEGDVLNIDVTAKHPDDGTDTHDEPAGYSKSKNEEPASTHLADEVVETPEVYLVQDGIYAYDEAEPLCRAYGSRLATMGDLYDAWRKGADWCTYGWVKGHKAVYPTQKGSWVKLQESDNKHTRTKCGVPGLNGGLIKDRTRRFGVHCYGIKPPTWRNYMANTMASDNLTASELEKKSMVSEFRRKLNKFTVAPFSKQRWSDVYKTPADPDISTV